MGIRRALALLLSAMMLLTPVMGSAEGYGFSAGDLTLDTLSESYAGGCQINASFGFDVDKEALAVLGDEVKAAGALLDMMQVNLSFYDDFGTARIRGGMTLDGVQVVSGDMLIFEDGSVQLVTSLTGNMAFTLPAGTVTEEGIHLPDSDVEWTDKTADQVHPFKRLEYASQDMSSTLINLLLGWVSGTQMETGELYTFDYETYIDATDTRDAVATRMIGKIEGNDLLRFLWNVVSQLRDREHDFQSALAYSIAEFGVTRKMVRQAADTLFPDDEVDFEIFPVTPSDQILDDGALITYEDVYYFLCKLEASLMNAWGENTLNEISSMIVSYDDFGEMVGFDAQLRPFTRNYPYEGDFTYSVRTDEDWQRMHTAHGELQVFDGKRIIGDMDAKQGEAVGDVNESHFNGQIDVVDQASGQSVGIGVLSSLMYTLAPDGMGESIEANADLMLNETGVGVKLIDTDFNAVSALTDMGLVLTGVLNLNVLGLLDAAVNVNVECVEYEDEPFEGGQAVDLSGELTDEQLKNIKDAVKQNALAIAPKFALKPAVLGNLLTLTELLSR